MIAIKNITRHVTEDHKGWYVRVRRTGKIVRKYFSDSKYGGKAKSLNTAILWRNTVTAKRRDGRLRRRECCSSATK